MTQALNLSLASALGFAALAMAFPASAQDVTNRAATQFQLSASAPGACRIQSPTTVSSSNASFAVSSASAGQITISQISSPTTGLALSSRISLQFDAVCNVAHAMRISSTNGGLSRDEGRNVGTFSGLVGYRVDARWAGTNTSLTLDGTPRQVSIPIDDGAAGTLELDLETQAGTSPLANGRYSDALVVEMTAAS